LVKLHPRLVIMTSEFNLVHCFAWVYTTSSVSHDNSFRIALEKSIPDLYENTGTAQMEGEAIVKITKSFRHDQERMQMKKTFILL
jgi:hypothetical protein